MSIAALRAELARRRARRPTKERQLERYAADLRETFKASASARHELRDSYMATVRALSNAVEARDAYTGKHAERVAAYGLEIARALGSPLADDPEIEFGFLLHDVGKVAVPDAILYKPEPLTPEERTLMARHPVIGARDPARDRRSSARPSRSCATTTSAGTATATRTGCAGEEIPLAARVFAVADTLDALTTDRPYRPARLAAPRRAR